VLPPANSTARRLAWWLVILFALPGCSLPWSKSPRQTVKTASGALITQTGDAKVPGNVSTVTTAAEIPLPAGTTIRLAGDAAPQLSQAPGGAAATPQSPARPAAPLEIVLPAPSVLRASTTAETVNGPEAHGPPTAGEVAKAAGLKWFYIGGVVCFLAALWFLKSGHPVNAGVCALGALGLPTLGNVLGSEWAVRLGIGVAVASAALLAAWFLLRKYHPEYVAELKAKADQLKTKAEAAATKLQS
jgi:hypothetical protein